ncbi:hypothetical protein DY000_02061067 [Brassica cretica]|uniref:Transposase Tnp1/En/Spm-like domain-containing protein n=1 Tax=Brassica cretica TaxID=69181 RepID=A0ABQ7AQZ0_BRACR|nr:hypothetical protein DY000_02061067 [Brassica cretica]
MSSSNYFRSRIDRPHLDPNKRLLTEEYQRGITEFMGTSEPQLAVILEEPIRTDVDYGAEENDGEPVDDLALMRRAYTNKKTGQIDDGLVRDVVDLVQTQVVDEVSQLQTEDDASTASTNLSRFRINEIVESSVPKKKGRLVGLGRRSWSAAPSSAPPPYVDPEVLTAQLKDKDDRISALETQMAAQHAGYETQKRLNEQMMEMMKRMYPNEVFPNIQDP